MTIRPTWKYLFYFYHQAPLDDFFALVTLSSLAIGLTAMLSALRCFGSTRAIFWRWGVGNCVSWSVWITIQKIRSTMTLEKKTQRTTATMKWRGKRPSGHWSVSGLIFTFTLTFITIWSSLSTLHCSEAAAGVNRISYFVAVNVAQIPIIVITPVVYLSLLYSLIAPRGRNRRRFMW